MRTSFLLLSIIFCTQSIDSMQTTKHAELPHSFYMAKAHVITKEFSFKKTMFKIKTINYLENIIRRCKKGITDSSKKRLIINLLNPGYIWEKNKSRKKKSYDEFRFKFAEMAYRFLTFGIRYNLKCYFGKLTKEEQPLKLQKVTKNEYVARINKQYPDKQQYDTLLLKEGKKLAEATLVIVKKKTTKLK